MDDSVRSPEDDIGQGRILRVKEGYNPNSSSLGSVVFVYTSVTLLVPTLLTTAASTILAAVMRRPGRSGESRTGQEDSGSQEVDSKGDLSGRS